MVSQNLFCVALHLINHRAQKLHEPRTKLSKRINKSVLSHITFDLEDDDQKPVDFKEETIRFTCQYVQT